VDDLHIYWISIVVIGDKIALVGSGGAAKDILCQIVDAWKAMGQDSKDRIIFVEPDHGFVSRSLLGFPVISMAMFDPNRFHAILAIGDSQTRAKAIGSMPTETKYGTIIHPSCVVSEWIAVGEGSVISAGSILTCDITLGKHTHINYGSTIGHDFEGGDFYSAGPGSHVNGNCKAGQRVYLGSNAALKQGVQLADDVYIGMGSVVLNSISEAGSYAGNPVSKIR